MKGSSGPAEPLSPVNALLTRLHSVNRELECLERVRQTKTVGFRVPALAKLLYDMVLTVEDKEAIKYLVEGLVYALAKRRLNELPCEQTIDRRMAATASMLAGQNSVVFNVSVNVAEQKQTVNVNVNIINKIKTIAEELHRLRGPLPPKQRELVEKLFEAVQKLN